jgi:alginate O-acetyltransferase complex protein AlgI
LFELPNKKPFLATKAHPAVGVAMILFFIIIEWMGREQQYALANLGRSWHRGFRWAFYYILIIAIFLFIGKEQQFIYFQF